MHRATTTSRMASAASSWFGGVYNAASSAQASWNNSNLWSATAAPTAVSTCPVTGQSQPAPTESGPVPSCVVGSVVCKEGKSVQAGETVAEFDRVVMYAYLPVRHHCVVKAPVAGTVKVQQEAASTTPQVAVSPATEATN